MKLLWVQRPVPDSYVDPSFLSQLKRNQGVVHYRLATIVGDSSVLLTNIALGVIFALVFVAIYVHNVNWWWFVGLASGVDVVLAFKWAYKEAELTRVAALKSVILIVFAVLALTPVFHSLTESTSSDSIWAICGWLLLANVALSSRASVALSTNTALAATIVLASRLPTSIAVFGFVLFSIQTYVALPTALKWLRAQKQTQKWAWGLCTTVLLSSDVLVVWILGVNILLVWLIVQAFVLLGIPSIFMMLQKHKDQISGPWDPAKPKLD